MEEKMIKSGTRPSFFRKALLFYFIALFFVIGGVLSAEELSEVTDTAVSGSDTEVLLPLAPLEERKELERKSSDNPFGLIPHKTNYLLPYTWNSTPNSAYDEELGGRIDRAEVHFQISLKVPLLKDFWGGRGNLFFAYTNRSWWQAYNRDASSPFRETNHEPEIFLSYGPDWSVRENIRLANLVFGLNHQSNGKGGQESRSWNRIYLAMLWELGEDVVFSVRPWYRIPEDKKKYPGDASGDDNPDIHNYMGYGDIGLACKFGKDKNQTLAVLFRNNLRFSGSNKGAVQVDWTFPLCNRMKLYVQYFNGYGESLLDYNASVNRIGVGFLLTDWL